MPHITVTTRLGAGKAFDRARFAQALHPVVVTRTESTGTCKTLFRDADDIYLDGASGETFVHVEIGLLPGRPVTVREDLADAALGLLRTHLSRAGEWTASVEVRELDASYRLARTHVPMSTTPAARAQPTV
jgi:5-carboxymethyl-2-hydroxymuconate isomerase